MWKVIREFLSKFVEVSISIPTDKDVSCTGKVKYGHRRTAEKVVVKMEKKGSKPLEAYKCRYCESWHIGGRL
jgi:hypothetical protein